MNHMSDEELWEHFVQLGEQCDRRAEELAQRYQPQTETPQKRPVAMGWRYAAAAAVLAAVAGLGIAILTHPTPQHYAYSETESGVRIYCESGCDADDVLQQINETILTLD